MTAEEIVIIQTIVYGIGFLLVFIHQRSLIKSLRSQINSMEGTLNAQKSLYDDFKKYFDIYDPDRITATIDLSEKKKELEKDLELNKLKEDFNKQLQQIKAAQKKASTELEDKELRYEEIREQNNTLRENTNTLLEICLRLIIVTFTQKSATNGYTALWAYTFMDAKKYRSDAPEPIEINKNLLNCIKSIPANFDAIVQDINKKNLSLDRIQVPTNLTNFDFESIFEQTTEIIGSLSTYVNETFSEIVANSDLPKSP